MPYGVHITRRSQESVGDPEITLAEWTNLIDKDDSLESRPFIEIRSPDNSDVIRKEGRGIAAWRGHPETGNVWFTLSQGEITVGNPDTAILNKMTEIAASLGAEVRGDEGELYPLDIAARPVSRKKPFWKFW